MDNIRNPGMKKIKLVNADSTALDRIANWHAKKNIFFCLNNFQHKYSDSHNITNPAPHAAETSLWNDKSIIGII